MESYYVDTCIWLNLFKKEGDETKGKPYWEIAKNFIDSVLFSQNKQIVYSGIVFRELRFKLSEDQLIERANFIVREKKFKYVVLLPEDYSMARVLERKSNYSIGFYDCMHVAVCKRCNFTLVTRDKQLIEFGSQFIPVLRPENLP